MASSADYNIDNPGIDYDSSSNDYTSSIVDNGGHSIARTHCRYRQTASQHYIPIQPQHYYPSTIHPQQQQQQEQQQQQQYAYYPSNPNLSAYDVLASTVAPSDYFAQNHPAVYYQTQPFYPSQQIQQYQHPPIYPPQAQQHPQAQPQSQQPVVHPHQLAEHPQSQPQQYQQYQQPIGQYQQLQQQQQQHPEAHQNPEIIAAEATEPGQVVGTMASPNTRRGPCSFQRLNKVRK